MNLSKVIIISNNTIKEYTPEDPLFQIINSEITIKLVIKDV
jgi:hypothetical protein